jgi:hypothetical protein
MEANAGNFQEVAAEPSYEIVIRERAKADKNPNAEYFRNFYAYYRQPPPIKLVIDRFIVDNAKHGGDIMKRFGVEPFSGVKQKKNYTEEQKQEAYAAQIRQNQVKGDFSAIPLGSDVGGKKKSKKYRYNKKSKTNKKRRSRSNKKRRSRK